MKSAFHWSTRVNFNEPLRNLESTYTGWMESFVTSLNTHKRRDIQVLRGFAVILVLAFHAELPIPGGFIGVDIFFVLSGFVISELLRREYESTQKIRFKDFYLKRYMRLAPNLGLMVAFTLIVVSFLLTPFGWQQNAQKTGFAALFSSSNLVLPSLSGGYFDLSASLNPFLHTWSLSVEEQFYLFFPVLLLISFRKKTPKNDRRVPIDLILFLTILSLGLSIVISLFYQDSSLINFNYYSPITRIWEFGFGVVAARISHRSPIEASIKWGIVKDFTLFLMLGSAFIINSKSDYPGVITLFPVICASLYLYLDQKSFLKTRYFHSSRFLSRIGDISYSLYLWHWPFVVFAKAIWDHVANIALYGTLASIIPAYIAYKYVELPIKNKTFFSTPKSRYSIIVWTIVPMLIAASTWYVASKFWKPKFQSFITSTQNFKSLNGDCHFDSGFTEPTACFFNSTSQKQPIYLIGDSNAAHFAAGLEVAAKQINRPLIVATGASCPLIREEILFNGRPQVNDCDTYYSFVMNMLASKEPGLVLLSFSDGYFTDSHFEISNLATNDDLSDVSEYEMLRQSLSYTIDKIQKLGHKIIFINPIPHFSDQYNWNPRTCLIQELLKSCEQAMPLSFSEEIQEPFVATIQKVAQAEGVTNINFTSTICPKMLCKTRDSKGWIYSDATHLTNSFSERISPLFLSLLKN
jgi:peptidoglycan/LPS O-acetylase OafA/YrhL